LIRGFGIITGILLVTVLVSLPQSPGWLQQGRDSGVFSYTAQVLLHGGQLYHDAWDNKPPLVYFINALAMIVFGENLWSLWLIQIISLWITGLLFYYLLTRIYQQAKFALAGTVIFLFQAHHFVITGAGNFVEIYSLLPQVLCFIAGYNYLRQPDRRWAVVLGFAASLTWLLKQNTIGAGLAFPAVLMIFRSRDLRSQLIWSSGIAYMILGGLVGVGGIALYLLAQGILFEALDAIFIAPMMFHDWLNRGPVSPWISFGSTLTASSVLLTMSPLALLVFYSCLAALWRKSTQSRAALKNLWQNRASRVEAWGVASSLLWPFKKPLLQPFALVPSLSFITSREYGHPNQRTADPRLTKTAFGLWITLSFFIDFALANLSNRGADIGYGHYYLTPMPAFILMVLRLLAPASHTRLKRITWVYVFGTACLWLPVVLLGQAIVSGSSPFSPALAHPLISYVVNHSLPEETVLVWGASSKINFQAKRRSPTRFHYAYYLIIPGEDSRQNIKDFMDDLEQNQPALIVDSTLNDGYRVPPLDPAERREWEARGGRRDVEDLTPLYQFVADHCTMTDRIDKFQIYQCSYES
jgi:4-amino-4-deoxy-L-arabinose transferase-like glycosyltransferase